MGWPARPCWCPACGRVLSATPSAMTVFCACLSEPGHWRHVTMEEGVPVPGTRLVFVWED